MESMFSSPAEAALQREAGMPGLLTPLPDLDRVLPCSSLTSYWEMLWLWLHDWRRRQGQRCSFWVTQPTAAAAWMCWVLSKLELRLSYILALPA
ncbi:DPH2 isoform 2 [Pongo abelii]|uniref:DPH2 isoform 2 n=1 Tax=Pongo abelii TaxID=9601 RepID=A0A2J8SM91_PONAB|nr:DPH2 isoform 2 [Pongo abelii]